MRTSTYVPTFYHDTGSSRLDYMFLPRGMEAQVVKATVLRSMGAKLQAIRGPAPRDHLPFACCVAYNKGGGVRPQEAPGYRWNFDLLMDGLRRGSLRWEFLRSVQEGLRT
eukprot:3295025-Pyramimonas_sp.AAC.1